jgi:hypothetical protein
MVHAVEVQAERRRSAAPPIIDRDAADGKSAVKIGPISSPQRGVGCNAMLAGRK